MSTFKQARGMLVLLVFAAASMPAWAQRDGRQPANRGRAAIERLKSRFDADQDGKITRDEFSGPPARFDQFDSDGDRAITAKDFDRPNRERGKPRTPAAGDAVTRELEFNPQELLDVLDDDRNGEISRDELLGFLDQLDFDGSGSLSLKELRMVGGFARDHTLRSNESITNRLRRFQDFPNQQPTLGDVAPPFELHDLEGNVVSLAELLKTKPVLIETGSYTCPVFRGRHASIEELAGEFGDRVHLVVLYGREAHPGSGRFGEIKQPTQTEDRVELAADAAEELSINVPVIVDTIEDQVLKAYGALPNCGYLIGQDGRVFYKMSWIHPDLMRGPLQRLVELGGSGGADPPEFPVGGTHPSNSGQPRQDAGAPIDVRNFKDAPVVIPPAQHQQIAWIADDWDKANGIAADAGVTVLAQFHFDGCPICAAMAKGPLADPQVVAASRKFVPVKIDLTTEQGKTLGEKLSVVGTPTFLVLSPQGEVVAGHEGHADPEAIIAFLTEALSRTAPSKKQ